MREKEIPAPPKPVFLRVLTLLGGGVGCLLAGIVVSLVTGDLVILALSVILCVTFTSKGVLLKRKIAAGQIYSVSGVCVGITPKILGRYKRVELVNTDTGDTVQFVLPKKSAFKIGYVYTCYFDHHINNRLVSVDNSQVGYFNAELDLPANGFLGLENYGIYQGTPTKKH
ncbi:MAG: hypothetical protein FWG87_01700 [Defluviitaleaceae bacterium]|nr:hypothetical protein [Defluviitaleaceae bacterium]